MVLESRCYNESMWAPTNPSKVDLEVIWRTYEGAPKLDVVSGTVTVYHRDAAGDRVVDLAPAPLIRDLGTSVWRYVWAIPPLTEAGLYTVLYTAVDVDGAQGITKEELTVQAGEGNTETLLDAFLGEQKLDAVQKKLTLYKRDGGLLVEFDTFDDVGDPASEDVYERRYP